MKIRASAISLTESVGISLVDRRIVKRRIVMCSNKPEHGVGHVWQVVVGHKVACGDQADAGLVHAALHELRHKRPCLIIWHKHEKHVRFEIASTLQKRRKIW